MNIKIDWKPFQSLYDLGMTDKEIAEEMGIDTSTASKHRRELGLPSNWTKETVRAMRREKKPAPIVKSLAEVAREAKEHGMSYGEYMVAQREGKRILKTQESRSSGGQEVPG